MDGVRDDQDRRARGRRRRRRGRRVRWWQRRAHGPTLARSNVATGGKDLQARGRGHASREVTGAAPRDPARRAQAVEIAIARTRHLGLLVEAYRVEGVPVARAPTDACSSGASARADRDRRRRGELRSARVARPVAAPHRWTRGGVAGRGTGAAAGRLARGQIALLGLNPALRPALAPGQCRSRQEL